jgi:cytochrome b6-f complex iron-sulfur subunit
VSTQTPARRTGPTSAPRGTLDDWCPSRRTVMRTLAALGGVTLVPGLLVACGGDDGGDATGGDDAGSGASGSGGTGGGSIAASDVAVGTAVVVQVDGAAYVVAQPAEGEFVAFDARCTHQGTTVEAGEGTTLVCPNHGSEFDAADGGAVLQGPATSALAAVDVTVDGDQLVVG